MPFKNNEERKAYYSKWLKRNRERVRQYQAQYYRDKGLDIRKRLKMKYDEEKLALERIFGNTCHICGGNNRLSYHEIHGRKHPVGRNAYRFILDNLDDFIRLCYSCHWVVHRLPVIDDNVTDKLLYLRGLIEEVTK